MSFSYDDHVLGGEPCIDGTRIGVRHVRVINSGQTAAIVADQLNVSLADVYDPLSNYYAHINEMRGPERRTKPHPSAYVTRN